MGLNIREVGQSLIERLSWTAFQKKIKHQVSSKVSLKIEYYFIIVNGFSCVFQPTLRRLRSVQPDFNWHKSPASPACRQESNVEGCASVLMILDELDLRGVEVTLEE